MRKLWLLLPLLAFFGFKALAAENPVLKIEGGQIQGVTCETLVCMYIKVSPMLRLLSATCVGKSLSP